MKKIATLLMVLMMMLASFSVGAENLRGDVDQDDRVSIADLTTLIDYLLTGDATGISIVNADTDRDTRVSIADVTTLIGYLLTSEWPQDEQDHEWVDLGLPSGTLWATCNVGANSPEEYGDYFAWGETEAKDYYYFSNTKWVYFVDGAYCYLTKYCTQSENGYNGFTDGKTELDPEDDAAYVNWGPLWRMPTLDQQKELIDNCSCTWTAHNGVYGYQVTGHNGNSIFLPVAGHRWQDSLYSESFGFYWSRTLGDYPVSAYYLLLAVNFRCEYSYRSQGHSVRAVRVSQD